MIRRPVWPDTRNTTRNHVRLSTSHSLGVPANLGLVSEMTKIEVGDRPGRLDNDGPRSIDRRGVWERVTVAKRQVTGLEGVVVGRILRGGTAVGRSTASRLPGGSGGSGDVQLDHGLSFLESDVIGMTNPICNLVEDLRRSMAAKGPTNTGEREIGVWGSHVGYWTKAEETRQLL
jgi:hypothetical protein